MHIVGAIELRKVLDGEWLLIVGGIAGVLFGIGAAIFPGAGALAIVTAIGIYAIFAWVLLIGLGLHVRSLREQVEQPATGSV